MKEKGETKEYILENLQDSKKKQRIRKTWSTYKKFARSEGQKALGDY